MTKQLLLEEIATYPFKFESDRNICEEWLAELDLNTSLKNWDRADYWYYSMHRLANRMKELPVPYAISHGLYEILFPATQ